MHNQGYDTAKDAAGQTAARWNEEMNLTDQEIRRGFWYYDQTHQFPPRCITRPDEYEGGERLNVACTQLEVSASEQRAIVRQWCEALPQLTKVRFLWFSSRVNQEMFDAVSKMQLLEGLYVKWSGIKTLASIETMSHLRFFHLGSSGSLENIDVLSEMKNLIVLELENLQKIKDLRPLSPLTQLEGLGVQGSMEKTQVVDSLAPLSHLTNLRYLFLANLRAKDKTLRHLNTLRSVIHLRTAWWWPDEEFGMLRTAMPDLRWGNPLEQRPIR